ncbi:MAG TPA: hypothetical protein P5556_11240 [Candidatus Gastranaerophilales bacterium]|nr:hypothetical protein [Candidatus Gastranaerophilales bacterium]
MLPLIVEEIRVEVMEEALQDVSAWRKKMIHYIKEENPEINAAIIDAAGRAELDPKALALGAYLSYRMLERAAKEESGVMESILE